MNKFFKKIAAIIHGEQKADVSLGAPAVDRAAYDRRMTLFRNMRGGDGFAKEPGKPRKNADGLTRGQRRRAMAAKSRAKVSEQRPVKYRHASATR